MNNKIGLKSFIWMGFTLIAGITYTAAFSAIVSKKDDPNSGVGIHILWIYIIEAMISFMCAWAFVKLIKHHPKANGGISQFSRSAFGKFPGLLMGIMNYGFIPLTCVVLLVTMLKVNLGDGSVLDLVGKNGKWGKWGELYLDLIAVILYLSISCFLFLGVRHFKKISIGIGIITWGITAFLMIAAMISWAQPNHGIAALKYYSTHNKLSYDNISNAFTTSFLIFCGIETIATNASNIKNRKKNAPKAITWIVSLVTIWYVVSSVVLLGAISGGFETNPNIQVFETVTKLWPIGGWLVVICTVLLRLNSLHQLNLYGGSMLGPMAHQHYLPSKIGQTNKEQVPVGGVVISIAITLLISFLFLFIPDIIKGVTGQDNPFNYANLASCLGILFMMIYGVAIIAVIKFGITKKIKIKIWEYIGWIIALVFIIFQIINYFITVFINLSNDSNIEDINNFIAAILKIAYPLLLIIISIILFIWYHPRKLREVHKDEELLKNLLEYEKAFIITSTSENTNKKNPDVKDTS